MNRNDLAKFFAKGQMLAKPSAKFSVMVSTFSRGNYDPEANVALLKLLACPDPRMMWHPRHETSSIDIARSLEATLFLERKLEAEVLLFLDDDIVFDPLDIRKLCVLAREGMDIIGAPYVLKQIGNSRIADKLLEGQKLEFSPNSLPIKTRWLAGGCLAMSRKALMALSQKLPKCEIGMDRIYPFFCHRPKEIDGKYVMLPEGWSFCELAQENGLPVWIDPSIRLKHIGRYAYTIEDTASEPKKQIENLIYSEVAKV